MSWSVPGVTPATGGTVVVVDDGVVVVSSSLSCSSMWSSRAVVRWARCCGSGRRSGRRSVIVLDATEHLTLHGELRIGDQHHHAAIGVDLGDLADQACAVGDRHADGDAVATADGDLDGVLEVARCLADDLGGDSLMLRTDVSLFSLRRSLALLIAVCASISGALLMRPAGRAVPRSLPAGRRSR